MNEIYSYDPKNDQPSIFVVTLCFSILGIAIWLNDGLKGFVQSLHNDNFLAFSFFIILVPILSSSFINYDEIFTSNSKFAFYFEVFFGKVIKIISILIKWGFVLSFIAGLFVWLSYLSIIILLLLIIIYLILNKFYL